MLLVLFYYRTVVLCVSENTLQLLSSQLALQLSTYVLLHLLFLLLTPLALLLTSLLLPFLTLFGLRLSLLSELLVTVLDPHNTLITLGVQVING